MAIRYAMYAMRQCLLVNAHSGREWLVEDNFRFALVWSEVVLRGVLDELFQDSLKRAEQRREAEGVAALRGEQQLLRARLRAHLRQHRLHEFDGDLGREELQRVALLVLRKDETGER